MTDQIGKIFVKHTTPNLVEVFTDKYKGVDGTKDPILLAQVYHYRTNIYKPEILVDPDLYPDIDYRKKLQQTDSLASAVKSIAHYFYTELRKQDFYVDQHGPIPDIDSLKPMDPIDNLKEEFITVKPPKFEIERIVSDDKLYRFSETYNVIYYYIFDMNNHVYGLANMIYPIISKRPVRHLIGIVKCTENNTTRQREVVSSIIRYNEHFDHIGDIPKTMQEAIKRVIDHYLANIKGLTKYWSNVPKNLRIDESLSVKVKEPDKLSIGYGILKIYMIYDSNQYIGEVQFRKNFYHAYSTHDNENVDPRHSEKVYGRFDKLNTAIQFLDKVHKYYIAKQIDESLSIKPLDDLDTLYNNNDRKTKTYTVLYSGRIIGEVMFSTDKYIAFSIHTHHGDVIYSKFTKLKDAIEFLRNMHNQNSKEVIRESLTVTPNDPNPIELNELNIRKIYTVKFNGIYLNRIYLKGNGEYLVVIVPNVTTFTKLNDAIQFICKINKDKINESFTSSSQVSKYPQPNLKIERVPIYLPGTTEVKGVRYIINEIKGSSIYNLGYITYYHNIDKYRAYSSRRDYEIEEFDSVLLAIQYLVDIYYNSDEGLAAWLIKEEENVYTSKLKVVKTFETEDGVTYGIYDDSRQLGRVYYDKMGQFYHSIPKNANIPIGTFYNVKDAIEYILNPPDPDIPIDESTLNENQNIQDSVNNIVSNYRNWTRLEESTDKKIVKKQPKYSVKRTVYGRIIGYDVYLGNKRIGSVEYFPKTGGQHPYIISAPEDIPDKESWYTNLNSAIQHIIKFHSDKSQVSESKKYTPKGIKIEKLENDDSVIEYQMHDERRYLGTIYYMKHHDIYSATTPGGGSKFDIPSIKEAAVWILKEQPMKESEENKVPKIIKVKENEITCVYNVYFGKLVGTIYRNKSDNNFSVYRYNHNGTNYFYYKTTTTLQDAINSLLTK